MKHQSVQEKIVQFLKERGSTELPSKSRKYRKFTYPNQAPNSKKETFYWVGKKGALRAGPAASNSVSITHYLKKRGLIKGENHAA